MECVYIGDKFYVKSKTRMSSLYEITTDGYKRTDWGFIHSALKKGESVHIRPAIKEEKTKFEEQLNETIKEQTEIYNQT